MTKQATGKPTTNRDRDRDRDNAMQQRMHKVGWSVALAVAMASSNLLAKGTDDKLTPEEIKHATEMVKAIGSKDMNALKTLVETKGFDVNSRDRQRQTPLMYASRQGKATIVQFLLEKGADMWMSNQWGSNALHLASSAGHLKVVEVLAKWGAYLDQPSKNSMTALHMAIQSKRKEVAQFLLSEGADINIRTSYGHVALHFAVLAHSIEMVRWVLSKVGTDQVHVKNSADETPVHRAAKYGLYDIAILLIREGNVKVNDEQYSHLLMADAVQGGSIPLVNFLKSKGLRLDFTDNLGNNAFHLITKTYNKTAMLQFLLQQPNLIPSINHTNHDNKVPLYYILTHNRQDYLKAFLKAGADLKLLPNRMMRGDLNAGHFPPLHYVVSRRSTQMLRLLANHKDIDLDLKDKDDKTALDHAKDTLKNPNLQKVGKEMVQILEEAAKTRKKTLSE